MSRVQSDRLKSLGVKQSGMGVIGYGSAVCEDIRTIKRKGASLYADPAAWLVADAMEQALNACSAPWQEARKEIGVISISDRCTLFTMNGIASGAQNGQVSPLRFAGANPGSITGLPCKLLFTSEGSTIHIK